MALRTFLVRAILVLKVKLFLKSSFIKILDTPLPKVDGEKLNLETTPDEPRLYLQTMFELIYLAFKTDSTRVASYQIGRENGVGISDRLAKAVGFSAAHQLSHDTKQQGGWKNFEFPPPPPPPLVFLYTLFDLKMHTTIQK